MKLYHYTDKIFASLKPMFGERRNSAEDIRIVGIPVIWLAEDGDYRMEKPAKYRYTVSLEVGENLLLDEDLYYSSILIPGIDGTNSGVRWYTYTQEISSFILEEWDYTACRYKFLYEQ
ncbi:hypothetical protein [Bacillus weihaiensis]|uniref:hypothetical protein n=1 Tax=Bacillus weihaiensis TaxID=1547283 RepID=UPI002356A657|nr:hypothetical protein [Bacillus weihaiensis]